MGKGKSVHTKTMNEHEFENFYDPKVKVAFTQFRGKIIIEFKIVPF